MSRITRKAVLITLLCVIGIGAIGIAGYWGYWWYRYPYGVTHRCPILLSLALQQYALEHDGKFPAGEATPEASLSLLYKGGYIDAETLAGNSKSGEVAKRILESGGLLGPDTCDWHYVEGLAQEDHGDIAIFWAKSSLGHRGKRLHGGHQVSRLYGGGPKVIPAERWEAFLAEQKELLANREKRD